MQITRCLGRGALLVIAAAVATGCVHANHGAAGPAATFCKDEACASAASEFRAGEEIHVMLPPSERAKRVAERSGRWLLGVTTRLDGSNAPFDLEVELPRPTAPAGSNLVVPIVCDAERAPACAGTWQVAAALARLAPGTHRLRVDVLESHGLASASLGGGDITLVVTAPNGYARISEVAGRARTQRRLMPEPAFRDEALEAEVKALAAHDGLTGVQRAVFFRPWDVKRQPVSGVPISRDADVMVASGPEKDDEHMCRMEVFTVRQKHDGEHFGPAQIVRRDFPSRLLCDHVAK